MARRLKELGDRLRATFASNVAAGARPEVSGGGENEIVYDLGGPRVFNVAMLKEGLRRGQRIEAFALDAWDGSDWKEIARGTTVGWKKLLRFPSVTSIKVRLRILAGRREVALLVPPDGFGLYRDGAR
jgi:alpha-L-fucosidase